jgi:sugar/nucleoside kinase (ribokinase family)
VNGKGESVGGRKPGAKVVCLGEALVDLVCEQPVASLADAPSFVPRPGGSLANIATVAARFGAGVQMLGGAGDDEWGRWLRDRLGAVGVDVSRFRLVGAGTAHAFVAISEQREPDFAFYGGEVRPGAVAGPDLAPAMEGEPGVLVVGSDTIIEPGEREVTTRALELAAERGWLVLCDPNLRPRRWPNEQTMLEAIRELIAPADVIKLNGGEAMALSGEPDPVAAGRALSSAGHSVAAVTMGADGAVLCAEGEVVARAEAKPAELVDATGAGDSVAGVLAAALSLGVTANALGPALQVALGVASGVIERWGATDGLPAAAEARESLGAVV